MNPIWYKQIYMSNYTEQEIRKAQKKVKAKKGFYSHLTWYLAMMVVLFVINLTTSFGDWWFQFPLMGWGISIFFHYIGVFGLPGLNFTNKEWEEKELEKELDKIAPEKSILEDHSVKPDEELELKEFKKLRDEWQDTDFV